MAFKRFAVTVGTVIPLLLLGTAAAAPAADTTAQPARTRSTTDYLYTPVGDFDTVKPLLERPDIGGVQVLVTWKTMEPKKDAYDFSSIEQALSYTEQRGKKLFVQVQDRFFTPQAKFPDYLLNDPEYCGGAAPTTNENGLGNGPAGFVAAQWNPRVRDRFQRLLKAMAQEFDGRLAGVNLPETSTQVDTAQDRTGYSNDAYFDAELANMAYGAEVFTKTPFVQYVNFWPGEWNNDHDYMGRAFAFAKEHGVGLGGPDVLPDQPAQMHNAYPFFEAYRGKLRTVAMAVQEPDFKYKNPDTGKPYTREEFSGFASDTLGAASVFWAPSAPWLQEPAPTRAG